MRIAYHGLLSAGALLYLRTAMGQGGKPEDSGGDADPTKGPIDTCLEQNDCFTVTVVSETDTDCSLGGTCFFEACIELDFGKANCKKDDTLSHRCDQSGTDDKCPNDDAANVLPPQPSWDDADDATEVLTEVPTGDKQCQIGKGGDTLKFLYKDGDTCKGDEDGAIAEFVVADATVNCRTSDKAADFINGVTMQEEDGGELEVNPGGKTCTGNGPGVECVWEIKLPDCPSPVVCEATDCDETYSVFVGVDVECAADPCTAQECCDQPVVCDATDCDDTYSVFVGVGVECAADPCTPVECCDQPEPVVCDATDCDDTYSVFVGVGVECAADPCTPVECCDQPEPVQICSNDIPGIESGNSFGVVCCDPRCEKCGGSGCAKFGGGSGAGLGRGFCCVNPILENNKFCDVDTADAPCIISKVTPAPVAPDTPAPVAPDTPAPVAPDTPAPAAPDTPAPVAPDTPAPVEVETCSNGVPGIENGNGNGVVCCDLRCGACGGRGCQKFGGGYGEGLGRDFCCIDPILDNDEFCITDTEDAPCIISKTTPAPVIPDTPAPVAPDTPAPVVPDTLAPVAPDTPAPVEVETCSNGVPGIEKGKGNGVVCCDLRCGACGGRGCQMFGGGSDAGLGREFCCIQPILDNDEFCIPDTEDAPCIISKITPAPVPDATPAPIEEEETTPAPVPDATPAPVEEEASGCNDGTVGTENVSAGVCCDERCGSKCGGAGCYFFGGGVAAGLGPDFCCLKQIIESQVYCDGGDQAAPCILGGAPPTPAPVPQGATCSSEGIVGIQGTNDKGSVCCPLECNQCGGRGCSTAGSAAGLDNTSCCINGVLDNKNKVPCSDAGEAPCVL